MGQKTAYRQVVLDFFKSLNSSKSKAEVFPQFTTDQLLIDQFLFLEKEFPQFQILVDEVTAEEQRVVVKARIIGAKGGLREEIPFAMGYYISHGKIIDHWTITDTIIINQKTSKT